MMTLFPDMYELRTRYVNMNEAAKERDSTTDPDRLKSVVEWVHDRFPFTLLHGGLMEDRSYVLDHVDYLKRAGTLLHLGVDFWPPPQSRSGLRVAVARRSQVIRVDCDTPEPYGWGTTVAVDVKETGLVLLYGHLAPDVRCSPGQILEPLTVIGKLGEYEENGGWRPHLHVQAMTWPTFQRFICGSKTWKDLDGYGRVDDLARLQLEYPDPYPLIGFSK